MDFVRFGMHNQRMTKRRLMLAAAVAALLATPGTAALQQGAHVPSLVTQGALDGKPFPFNLQQALRSGPVVLYFFPKANTPGCRLNGNGLPSSAPCVTSEGTCAPCCSAAVPGVARSAATAAASMRRRFIIR